MYRILYSLVLICSLALGQGCYHYRVVAPVPNPATDYEHETVHSLFWGLLQEDTAASDCISGAIDEVRVSTNFAYLAVSILTMGIWVPLDVEWRCAKEPVPDGEL